LAWVRWAVVIRGCSSNFSNVSGRISNEMQTVQTTLAVTETTNLIVVGASRLDSDRCSSRRKRRILQLARDYMLTMSNFESLAT